MLLPVLPCVVVGAMRQAHSRPQLQGAAAPPLRRRPLAAYQQRQQSGSQRRLVVSAATVAEQQIQEQAAVQRLAAAAPAYAATLDMQQACLDLAVSQLSLQPVPSTAAPRGMFSCMSHDSGAGAAAVVYCGQRVHWCMVPFFCFFGGVQSATLAGCKASASQSRPRHLPLSSPARLSASALANPGLGVGTCRLLGWAPAARDVPHLLVDAEWSGDMVRGWAARRRLGCNPIGMGRLPACLVSGS